MVEHSGNVWNATLLHKTKSLVSSQTTRALPTYVETGNPTGIFSYKLAVCCSAHRTSTAAVHFTLNYTGHATVKLSSSGANRGGLVTGTGVAEDDNLRVFCRDDSFTSNGGGDSPEGGGATAAAVGGENGSRPTLRQASSSSDSFSFGGEVGGGDADGEGYWGKQRDPASGMTYYLNERVSKKWG